MMGNPLADKRVLVAEDEYFIASDIRRLLEQEGVIIIGPVGDLPGATRLAGEAEGIDAAILDVNLAGELTYPLARSLVERGVACMFLTGYDDWAIPEDCGTLPRVAKPFSEREVIETLTALVDAPGS
ncbi:response regulator [Stakelama pacifica]|nr:response regulator [Stakelama pacifica]MAW98396.1 response regulator [Sphingomonas sp.]GGO90875.1 response regulator [Stakelama pacifica]